MAGLAPIQDFRACGPRQPRSAARDAMISPGSSEVEVSICIPAFARPEELRQAIASALNQTVPASEILIGDDSRDLRPIVAEFDDPRLVYIENDSRLGMAKNWNSLLDRARGRYLALLMDDDVLAPTFLESCLAGFSSSEVGVSFSNHYFVNSRGEKWVRNCRLSHGLHHDFLIDLLRMRPVAVSAAIMRREVWAQVRPLPHILTADLYMHASIAAAGWSFYYVDKPLMFYRVHDGQLSGDKTRFRDDGVRLWELLKFDSTEAEAIRKRALARALISRAGARLQRNEIQDARGDLLQARRADLAATLTPRSIGVALLSRVPARWRSAVLRFVLGLRSRATVREFRTRAFQHPREAGE